MTREFPHVATVVARAALIASVVLSACIASASFAQPIIFVSGLERLEPDRTGTYRLSTQLGNDHPSSVAVDSSGNVYAANRNNTVTVYAPSGGGFTLKAQIGGPDTGLLGPLAVAVDQTGKIYVLTGVGGSLDRSILVYGPGSGGDAAPMATISGSKTGLTFSRVDDVAVDAAGNVYVTNDPASGDAAGSVLVYGSGANGNVSPRAVLNGGSPGFVHPTAIALDKGGNLYVASVVEQHDPHTAPTSLASIFVYPPGANGNATPIATITSSAGLGINSGIGGISVDAGGRIYVEVALPGGYAIETFAPGSNGDVVPATKISGVFSQGGIAVDQGGQIYLPEGNSINVYAPGSNGDVAPLATITRGETWGLLGGFAVDAAGSVYACGDVNPGHPPISVFAPGTTDAPPVRTIGQYSGLGSIACTVDGQGNVYTLVESTGPGAMINEYAAGGGNALPIATIAGPKTGLESPSSTFGIGGLAVNRHGNIYVPVSNSAARAAIRGSILVFPPRSNGNVAPMARIAGPHTGLSGVPEGIALDADDNIYSVVGKNQFDRFGSVVVFSPRSKGDARPMRVIRLNAGRLLKPDGSFEQLLGLQQGIALDQLGNLYFSGLSASPGFAPVVGAVSTSVSAKSITRPRFIIEGPFTGLELVVAAFPPALP